MHTITITLREGVTLTGLIHPPVPDASGTPHPAPAIIICPGGGYQFLSEREADPVALRFAGMGYQAFILRYGVYGEESPAMPPNPHCIHPQPMLDIARAVLALHDHADAWQVDAARIILCGFSAGGHNVLMYATHWHRDAVTSTFGRPAEDFRPAGCIAGYALVDELLQAQGAPCHPRMAVCRKALLGTDTPSSALLHDVTPTQWVSPLTPPTFLWATAQDAKVPAANTLRMALALAEQGVPYEVHVFEEGEHGLALADEASAGIPQKLDARAAQWVGLCQTWLHKHFPLMEG